MKEHTKKNNIIIILMSIIIFLVGMIVGILIAKFQYQKALNDIDFDLGNKENVELTEYYKGNNESIYLYDLEAVNLMNSSFFVNLNTYLNIYEGDIEKLFKSLLPNLKVKSELNDGGTIIYTSTDDSNLMVIKCHTIDGNNDLVFGPSNMNTTEAFEKGACGKNFINDKEFKRIYKLNKLEIVKEIELEEKNVNLYELELSDESGNITNISAVFGVSLTLVIDENKFAHALKEEHLDILEEGKYYKFTFNNEYEELIKEDISEIFDKCLIKNIEIVEN